MNETHTKTYEATVYYDAADDNMADDLFDGICESLGCTDDPNHECPHFRLGVGPHEIGDSRLATIRASLRSARRELAYAFRVALKGAA